MCFNVAGLYLQGPQNSFMTRAPYTKMGETISYPKVPPRLILKILHDLRLLLDHNSYV